MTLSLALFFKIFADDNVVVVNKIQISLFVLDKLCHT